MNRPTGALLHEAMRLLALQYPTGDPGPVWKNPLNPASTGLRFLPEEFAIFKEYQQNPSAVLSVLSVTTVIEVVEPPAAPASPAVAQRTRSRKLI